MKKTLKIISLSFLTSAFLSNASFAAPHNSSIPTGAEEVNKNIANNNEDTKSAHKEGGTSKATILKMPGM